MIIFYHQRPRIEFEVSTFRTFLLVRWTQIPFLYLQNFKTVPLTCLGDHAQKLYFNLKKRFHKRRNFLKRLQRSGTNNHILLKKARSDVSVYSFLDWLIPFTQIRQPRVPIKPEEANLLEAKYLATVENDDLDERPSFVDLHCTNSNNENSMNSDLMDQNQPSASPINHHHNNNNIIDDTSYRNESHYTNSHDKYMKHEDLADDHQQDHHPDNNNSTMYLLGDEEIVTVCPSSPSAQAIDKNNTSLSPATPPNGSSRTTTTSPSNRHYHKTHHRHHHSPMISPNTRSASHQHHNSSNYHHQPQKHRNSHNSSSRSHTNAVIGFSNGVDLDNHHHNHHHNSTSPSNQHHYLDPTPHSQSSQSLNNNAKRYRGLDQDQPSRKRMCTSGGSPVISSSGTTSNSTKKGGVNHQQRSDEQDSKTSSASLKNANIELENEDALFGLMVGAELKGLPYKERCVAKLKIQNILFDMQMSSLNKKKQGEGSAEKPVSHTV